MEQTYQIAKVLLPLPLAEAFDYILPSSMTAGSGSFVKIPLGSRIYPGLIQSIETRQIPAQKAEKYKTILSVDCSLAPMPSHSIEFMKFAARWSCQAQGHFLRLMTRPAAAIDPPIPEKFFRAGTSHAKPKMTKARQKILDLLSDEPMGLTRAELIERSGVSSSVIATMAKLGLLDQVDKIIPLPADRYDKKQLGKDLSEQQKNAVGEIVSQLDRGFATYLLDGVTGSGKTEVYLESIAHLLEMDEQAQILVLLPEIALTQAMLGRFTERFGFKPVEWHSAGTEAKKIQWRRINQGKARLVIGARSALFLPFKKLRMIVVDEEHDASFKQDDQVRYQGRDLAVARAKFADAICVLGSATPSLETYENARSGRYRHLKLTERFGEAQPVTMELVDLRDKTLRPKRKSEHQTQWLSLPLREALKMRLERGEQSLLYLNRRGYAPAVICAACAQPLTSPHTGLYLSEHRFTGRLVCHLTGYSMPMPKNCPHCEGNAQFIPLGPGIERICEETQLLFPGASIELISSDIARDREQLRILLRRMQDGEIDILIGTQIIAKGHHFPRLTLVGIVDGDLGLMGADLRAGERSYQLLTQVAGRAGRDTLPGQCLIQTWQCDHPLMQALVRLDRDEYFAAELADREALQFPPSGRLAALILQGRKEIELQQAANDWAFAAPNSDKIDLYGPSIPPLEYFRGWYRRRFLLRADKGAPLSAYMQRWQARGPKQASIKVQIDMDPYNFF